MLYFLLQPLARGVKLFNLLNYITFRAAAAFVSALLVSFLVAPPIIRGLRAMAVNQLKWLTDQSRILYVARR